MPNALNDGVRLHYEVVGDGPPLVLQHGFAGNLEARRQCGYVQALQQRYKLILLDARGHGRSDKPHEVAAYALPTRVADVLAVLDAEQIHQAHFLGYSMGGWIGFGMAKYAPERLLTLILGGAHPYPDPSWQAFQGIDGTDPDAFIHALESLIGEKIPEIALPFVKANDLQALAASAQDRPPIADAIANITMPCLLFVGEGDARFASVQSCAEQIGRATYLPLPGANHATAFFRSDLLLPPLMRFLG